MNSFPIIIFQNTSSVLSLVKIKSKKPAQLSRVCFSLFTSEYNEGNLDSLNLLPRVLRVFGQRLVARRDSGLLEIYDRGISAVKHLNAIRCKTTNQKIYSFSNCP